MRLPDDAADEVRQAWPYALVLALGIGIVVTVGANLSTAYPSEERPFGWPGVADFDNGVAAVRSHLVLATTVVPLFLGVHAARQREKAFLPLVGADAGLVLAGVMGGTLIGWLGADEATATQLAAFVTAHTLLALAFFSLAFLAGALVGRFGAPLALSIWVVFHAIYEDATRWLVFRDAGYFRLAAGDFPTWFFAAQALSPLSAYRGILILWERGFMDYVEEITIGQAVLPAWVNPSTFATFMLVVWIALPLGAAFFAWRWRGRAAQARTRAAA